MYIHVLSMPWLASKRNFRYGSLFVSPLSGRLTVLSLSLSLSFSLSLSPQCTFLVLLLGSVEVDQFLVLLLVPQHSLTLSHVEIVVRETDERTNQSVVTSLKITKHQV